MSSATSAPKSMESSPVAIDIIEVCPFGTVILKAKRNTNSLSEGEEKASVANSNQTLRMRVSKEVMSVSSTSFKAMLQGPFQEATQAEVEIDEDADTLLNFCYIVHHRQDKLGATKKDMFWNVLWSLAELAERRGAIRTIQFWIGVQLRKMIHWNDTPAPSLLDQVPTILRQGRTCDDVLALGYICGKTKIVWDASRMFLVHYKILGGSNIDSATLSEHWTSADTFRGATELTDLLLKQRKTILDECLAELKKAILPPTIYCQHSYHKINSFSRALIDANPGILELASGNASHLQILLLVNKTKQTVDSNTGCVCSGCLYLRSGFNILHGVFDKLQQPPAGLCIYCFKAGKGSKAFSDTYPCKQKHD